MPLPLAGLEVDAATIRRRLMTSRFGGRKASKTRVLTWFILLP